MKMVKDGESLGKKPLPGERQGMSGADAGHDSMRDVGGRALRRRTPVAQQTTASGTQPLTESHTTTMAPPAERAAQEIQPALTQAGIPRQRMKWTTTINETVMRIFYRVTNLGQEMIGYRQQLHAEFCREYPHIQVTEQRIADQYRVILRNNLIPATRLNTIKREVEQQIRNQPNLENNGNDIETLEPQTTHTNVEETQPEIIQQDNNELCNELTTEVARALIEFTGTDPLSRPSLPKVNSSKKLGEAINIMNNRVLPNYVAEAETLESLHTLVYSSATAIVRVMGLKIKHSQHRKSLRTEEPMPPWERRLRVKIEVLRKDIGQLIEYNRGVRTRRLERRVGEIISNTRTHTQYEPTNNSAHQCLDTLKQRLTVFSQRLRRYKASNARKYDNKLFEQSERVFYRKLNNELKQGNTSHPSKQQIEEFWGSQLSTPTASNENASWMSEERHIAQGYNQMEHEPFTTDEISTVLQELHNWKAAGPDGVQNFWLKKLWCTHEKLATIINDIINNPQKMPFFLTQGTTYLIPKDINNTEDPAKYRPITCLPTLYKVITACLTKRIYQHCEQNSIIAPQQKGCTKGARGCKEQLIIDSVVCNQAHNKKRNLFTAYVDYKKAFDSIPHEWLLHVLNIYKVDPNIVNFLEHLMSSWRTKIELQGPTGSNIETDSIPIRRGIFQGDSLSPLWFCLAMNPLSHRLNSTNYGFALKNNGRELARLNHLLYMDDLKLFASTKIQLEQMLNIVEEFSNDIGMQFGLDKCRVLNIIRGQTQPGGYDMENDQTIEAMGTNEAYKYLGVKQARKVDHQTMKKELTMKFIKRVRQVLRTHLNSKNLFKALNTYACSALGYSFGIIDWSKTDIENLQRKVRTLLTKAHKHHPRCAVERTTLPRHLGGRGLMDIGRQLDGQIANLRLYFQNQAQNSELHRAICQVDHASPLRLKELEVAICHKTTEEKMRIWKEKPLHGRHPNEVGQDYVDSIASNYWLTSGKMFPETEGLLLAIQDQVMPTRNYLKYIVKDPSVQSDRCRYGCQTQETIQHLTGGCQAFAATEYKERHDSVGKLLHQELAKHLKLIQEDQLPYYKYTPEAVLENNNYKLYWDRSVLTDQRVMHNRPDLVLIDKNSRHTTLIDVAVPNNNNLRDKYNEKIAKYRDLEGQIKRQWKMEKVQTVPVIISTTGAIPKDLIKNIKLLGLSEHLYKPMQKAVLLATARTVRKFMGDAPAFQINHGPDNLERAPTELNPFDI